MDHLPLNLKVLTVSLRDSYTASEKREQLFSQSKESLHETTSFNLIASLHRSQRDRKLKVGNLIEKGGDILNIRYIKDFPEPVGNETETSLPSKNISMAFCCSS